METREFVYLGPRGFLRLMILLIEREEGRAWSRSLLGAR